MNDYANASLPSPTDQIARLAKAISDVGYWSWWPHEPPDVFQVDVKDTADPLPHDYACEVTIPSKS